MLLHRHLQLLNTTGSVTPVHRKLFCCHYISLKWYGRVDVKCKHPQLDQWAMPVLEYAEPFFDADELSVELSGDWITPIKKKK